MEATLAELRRENRDLKSQVGGLTIRLISLERMMDEMQQTHRVTNTRLNELEDSHCHNYNFEDSNTSN